MPQRTLRSYFYFCIFAFPKSGFAEIHVCYDSLNLGKLQIGQHPLYLLSVWSHDLITWSHPSSDTTSLSNSCLSEMPFFIFFHGLAGQIVLRQVALKMFHILKHGRGEVWCFNNRCFATL